MYPITSQPLRSTQLLHRAGVAARKMLQQVSRALSQTLHVAGRQESAGVGASVGAAVGLVVEYVGIAVGAGVKYVFGSQSKVQTHSAHLPSKSM